MGWMRTLFLGGSLYLQYLAGFDRRNIFETSSREGQKIGEPVGGRPKYQNSDSPPGEILLELDTLINGHKDLKSTLLGKREQFSVLLAAKSSLRYGLALVFG